jgi:SagB-type dehydrogenase family enzyme
MDDARTWPRATELDRTRFVEFRDRILASDAEGVLAEPRSYPGYPRFPLDRPRRRLWPPLDRVLLARRSLRTLAADLPPRRTLGRLLWLAYGLHAPGGRGPVPSAGGLQALELYLVTFAASWLPPGLYHYDRPGHHLSQIAEGADRVWWRGCVPSLGQVEGGGVLWALVGDAARVGARYGGRGGRFLLLEAGHLMQNLCLTSASLGLATVPLGGYFEREVARAFALPDGDLVLYVGVCGKALAAGAPGGYHGEQPGNAGPVAVGSADSVHHHRGE